MNWMQNKMMSQKQPLQLLGSDGFLQNKIFKMRFFSKV
jgi:hypothetical protein